MAEKTVPLPDRFHPLKRTLLILCSLIILSAIPGAVRGDANQTLLPWLQNVPIAGLRKVLWVAALYYAGGCLLEVIVARQDVSQFLRAAGNAPKTLMATLEALAQEFDTRRTTIAAYLEDLRLEGQKLIDRAPPLSPDQVEQLLQKNALDRTLWTDEEKRAKSAHEQAAAAFEAYVMRLPGLFQALEQKFALAGADDHEVAKRVRTLNDSIGAIDKAVTLPRLFLFYGFEVAGGAISFVAATILTWCPPAVVHFQKFLDPNGWFGI